MTRATKGSIAVAILIVAAIAFRISLMERHLLDYIDDYTVIDQMIDGKTGKVVELGRLDNFSSTGFEVGVFDDLKQRRKIGDLHVPVIGVVGNRLSSEKIHYDGKCYFVTAQFQSGGFVTPLWRDKHTNAELCFYILNAGGEKLVGDSQ